MTVTDPAHKHTAAMLRDQFGQPRTVDNGDGLSRDLADYDRAFGLDTIEVA